MTGEMVFAGFAWQMFFLYGAVITLISGLQFLIFWGCWKLIINPGIRLWHQEKRKGDKTLSYYEISEIVKSTAVETLNKELQGRVSKEVSDELIRRKAVR